MTRFAGKRFRKLVIFALASTFIPCTPVMGCAPMSETAVFDYTLHPSLPISRFDQGDLGVVRPLFARSYQVVAYRYLSGKPLTKVEQEAAMALWRARLKNIYETSDIESARDAWVKARSKVTDSKVDVEPYGSIEWNSYLNYIPDSFNSAVETLELLIGKFGATSQEVKDWVAAQDMVYGTKRDAEKLPALGADAPDLLKQEREYQLAAIAFYDRKYDIAVEKFDAISKDEKSRWFNLAPYLKARALTRKATLGPEADLKKTLSLARDQISSILSDQHKSKIHDASNKLLQFIEARLDPELSISKIGSRIQDAEHPERFGSDLGDLTTVMDMLYGDPYGQEEEDDSKPKPIADWAKKTDLTYFIDVFSRTDLERRSAALSAWQSKKSLPWLVCSLKQCAENSEALSDKDRDELIKASLDVDASSPGYVTVSYYLSSLLQRIGREKEALERVDSILASKSLAPTTVNMFKDLQLLMASSVDSFEKLIPREMAGYDYADLIYETPEWFFEPRKKSDEPRPVKVLVQPKMAYILNSGLPLDVFNNIAVSASLPKNVRADLAQAAFVRSVLLDRSRDADKLSVEVGKQFPALEPFLARYRAASTPQQKKFEALYLFLKYPGLRPFANGGLPRATEMDKIDNYRDNWWSEDLIAYVSDQDKKTYEKVPANILTAEKVAQAAAEKKKVESLGTAPNYLCREVLAYAKTNPKDARLPEALHLAVRSTRYGQTDDSTTQFSKECLQYLHKNFPENDWTKKTPYYF